MKKEKTRSVIGAIVPRIIGLAIGVLVVFLCNSSAFFNEKVIQFINMCYNHRKGIVYALVMLAIIDLVLIMFQRQSTRDDDLARLHVLKARFIIVSIAGAVLAIMFLLISLGTI